MRDVEKFPSFGGVAKFSKENFDGVVNSYLVTLNFEFSE